MGKSQGITSTSSRIRSRRDARSFSWVSTTGSSATEKFRKNMIELGREMYKLANEDHTYHIIAEEISVYRNNWWLRSNTVGSDTMPVRHRADFKQALSTLRQLKHQEDTAGYQKWQSSSSSCWNWQKSWWHSSFEHHRDDGPSIDWSEKPDGRWLGQLFEVWLSELIWCRTTVQNSVTAQRSSLSPTGGVNKYLQYSKILWKMATTKTKATMKAMRTNVRRITASSQTTSGTTRTTSSSQCTTSTPMTTLTSTIAWCTFMVLILQIALTVPHLMMTPHTSRSSSEYIHSHPRSYSWRVPFHSISPFFIYFSFLSFSVYFLFPELFLELDNPIVMASLRYSAAEESEDTLNSSASHT